MPFIRPKRNIQRPARYCDFLMGAKSEVSDFEPKEVSVPVGEVGGANAMPPRSSTRGVIGEPSAEQTEPTPNNIEHEAQQTDLANSQIGLLISANEDTVKDAIGIVGAGAEGVGGEGQNAIAEVAQVRPNDDELATVELPNASNVTSNATQLPNSVGTEQLNQEGNQRNDLSKVTGDKIEETSLGVEEGEGRGVEGGVDGVQPELNDELPRVQINAPSGSIEYVPKKDFDKLNVELEQMKIALLRNFWNTDARQN